MQRMSDRKSVGSDGGRAEILAQKPASGEPSEGFGRRVGDSESAGINRHVVGDERALQERKAANPSWP